MLEPVFTASFQRDIKRAQQRGYDMEKLKQAVHMLLRNERPFAPAYRDHPLKGKWKSKRELHIEPDWLLVYEVSETQCFFARTGTHSDIFNE